MNSIMDKICSILPGQNFFADFRISFLTIFTKNFIFFFPICLMIWILRIKDTPNHSFIHLFLAKVKYFVKSDLLLSENNGYLS